MLLSGPAVAGPEYAELLEVWREAFGDSPPGSYHAHAFDATNILLDAIESVARVTEDGEILVGREALRSANRRHFRLQRHHWYAELFSYRRLRDG